MQGIGAQFTTFDTSLRSVASRVFQAIEANTQFLLKKIRHVFCKYVQEPARRFIVDVQSPFAQNRVFGKEERFNNVRIILVNGIFNTMEDFEELAREVAQIFGHTIYGTYSPTHGLIGDIINVIKGLAYGTFFVAAEKLATNIKQRLWDIGYRENNPEGNKALKGRVVILAHSGGSVVLELARLYLTEQEHQMLDVTTYGSSLMFSNKAFYKVNNIINRGDIIPHICAFLKWNFLPSDTNIEYVSQENGNLFASHYLLSDGYKAALVRKKEELERAFSSPQGSRSRALSV